MLSWNLEVFDGVPGCERVGGTRQIFRCTATKDLLVEVLGIDDGRVVRW